MNKNYNQPDEQPPRRPYVDEQLAAKVEFLREQKLIGYFNDWDGCAVRIFRNQEWTGFK